MPLLDGLVPAMLHLRANIYKMGLAVLREERRAIFREELFFLERDRALETFRLRLQP